MEGNDYMADKIQGVIDKTIKENTLENLNEIVEEKEREEKICD